MPIGMNHNTFSVNAQEESTLEIGAIYGSARSSTPSGYLLCDGSAVSRTTYANLFSAIGTSFGVGNNSTTFNIPDGRGGTLRGSGTSSGYTQNVTVTLGTKDNDSTQGHRHSISDPGHSHAIHGLNDVQNDGYPTLTGSSTGWTESTAAATTGISILDSSSDGTNGNPRMANETKMKNIGINFFIKF
jgi:microcystin-dependent protein